MLKARRHYPELVHGGLELLDAPEPLVSFRRDDMICVFNLTKDPQVWSAVPAARPLGFGTGEASLRDGALQLGASSAWFGRL